MPAEGLGARADGGGDAHGVRDSDLGRPVKLRSVWLMRLRIVSLFNKDLRGLLQVAPD